MNGDKVMNKLGLIIPCYNEEAVLKQLIDHLHILLNDLISRRLISEDSFVLFVDDGSRDSTWSIISDKKSHKFNSHALKFSRNFGHQFALLAGMEFCSKKSDFNICIDADLQHDISKIAEFIEAYKNGADIVLGIKEERKSEPFLKKFLAECYYKSLIALGVEIYYNHADFRLMSTKATCELLKFEETNLFLRGIIPMMGFDTKFVKYNVKERLAGETKYSIHKMLSLAWNGITSTTIAPLRFFAILGFIIFICSIGQTIFVIAHYFKGDVIPGWASTVIPIYFIGSVQLISIGVIGEYIGKIYLETKKRPRFIISDQV
jgi:glycosyltransferase involved in cell wall biosynthesis